MTAEKDSAWDKVASQETDALRHLLEGDGRKVLVVVVALHEGEVLMLRSATSGTSRSEARSLLEGLERQADRINQKIGEPVV